MITESISSFKITGTGYWRQELPEKNSRIVPTYIIELFRTNGGSMNIEGEERSIETDLVSFTKPGQFRSSVAPFECWYVHFSELGSGTFMKKFDGFPTFFSASVNADHIITLFSRLRDSYFKGHMTDTGAELALLLSTIQREYNSSMNAPTLTSKEGKATIEAAAEYIQNNFFRPLKLADIAGAVHMSPNYFHSLFRRVMGETPISMLNRLRLEHAVELLMSGKDIQYTALSCGFASASSFSYTFKRHFGVPPGEWRDREHL